MNGHLRSFLNQRVRDGVLRRMIDKWLKAGVLEKRTWFRPETGTPQGGVISPLLANIYLHEVLDRWLHEVVRPRLRGRVFLVRYADDATIVFEHEEDARRVLGVLPKRCARFGLGLHPDKTKLVDFRSPGRRRPRGDEAWRPGTFVLLGFTHYWGRTRRGTWVVRRKTASKGFTAAVRRVGSWCRWNRHLPIEEQHRALSKKLLGHYGYFGITGNLRALQRFLYAVFRVWRYWLDHRSQRARMNWVRFARLCERYPLPPARVVHSVYRRVANSVV